MHILRVICRSTASRTSIPIWSPVWCRGASSVAPHHCSMAIPNAFQAIVRGIDALVVSLCVWFWHVLTKGCWSFGGLAASWFFCRLVSCAFSCFIASLAGDTPKRDIWGMQHFLSCFTYIRLKWHECTHWLIDLQFGLIHLCIVFICSWFNM